MSTQKESKISESFKVVYSTYGTETYWVRASDEAELDAIGAYDCEQIDYQTEWNDSEHDCNIRYLSSDEDNERLELHEMWKNGETKNGEQYYVKGIREMDVFTFTHEHHGAIFENCRFDAFSNWDGVDFDQITFINCEFPSNMVGIRDNCKGLIEETIAEKGTLMFERDREWNYDTHQYDWSYEPVVVMKYEIKKLGHQPVRTKFLAIKNNGDTLNYAGNIVDEETMKKDKSSPYSLRRLA